MTLDAPVRRTSQAGLFLIALALLCMGADECGAPEASEGAAGSGTHSPTAGSGGAGTAGNAAGTGGAGAGGAGAGGSANGGSGAGNGGVAGSSSACFHDGVPYSDGQEVPSLDGCNTCTCVGTAITCTERACLDAGTEDAGAVEPQCSEQLGCPQPGCACLDENEDGLCDNHCPSFECVAGRCVDTSERSCGGLLGLTCLDGEYCNYPIEAQCGAADQTGTCAPIVEAGCTLEYNPVCGCDGATYGNACAASIAGVSIASTGECL